MLAKMDTKITTLYPLDTIAKSFVHWLLSNLIHARFAIILIVKGELVALLFVILVSCDCYCSDALGGVVCDFSISWP